MYLCIQLDSNIHINVNILCITVCRSKVTRYIPIHRPSNVMLPVTSQPYKKNIRKIFFTQNILHIHFQILLSALSMLSGCLLHKNQGQTSGLFQYFNVYS